MGHWLPCLKVLRAILVVVCIALPVGTSVNAATDMGETILSFSVERNVASDAGIEAVCCNPQAYGFQSPQTRQVTIGLGESALWMRLELPAMAGLVQLTPVLDEATMYVRLTDGSWQAVRTGDQIAASERLFASPFMALPIPQQIADPVVYVRVIQTTILTIGAIQWELPSFVAMQAADQTMKTFLLGFICAMVLFNCVVSALVRDPAFLLNAFTICGILLVALYLSGYGAVHVWPSLPGWSNFFLAVGLTVTLVGGSLFMWVFVRAPGEPMARGWPLYSIGISAALAFGASALLPFHIVNTWLLASVAGLMIGGTAFVALRAFRGDSRARILLVPWLMAMAPGTVAVALDKLLGVRPFTLGNNTLEATLGLEAVLFSLALASRIWLSEKAAREAGARVLALRDESMARAIRAQDTERRRLAAELHDGVGQSFLMVLNALKRLARAPAPPNSDALSTLADATEGALGELRRISRDMHPSALEHLGLDGALQGLFAQLDAEGFDIQTQIAIDEDALDQDVMLHVYRIAQECLANIIRHADARKIRFELSRKGGLMRMIIEDDGIGFRGQRTGADDRRGLGFNSISERVRTLGGSWTIGRSELGGLAVQVRFPLAGAIQAPGATT
jgi:signal transduction histidine kinase